VQFTLNRRSSLPQNVHNVTMFTLIRYLGAVDITQAVDQVPTRGRAASHRQRNGALGDNLFQALQESVASHRDGFRNRQLDAGNGQVSRLLSGDDLR
jgi:hypothetical protein